MHDGKQNKTLFITFTLRTPIMVTYHHTRLDDLIYSRQMWYHSLPLSLSLCLCPSIRAGRLITQQQMTMGRQMSTRLPPHD